MESCKPALILFIHHVVNVPVSCCSDDRVVVLDAPAADAHAEGPEAGAGSRRCAGAVPAPHGHHQRDLQARQAPRLRQPRRRRRLHPREVLTPGGPSGGES